MVICRYCGTLLQKADKKCSGNCSAYYCSSGHEKLDKKEHTGHCFPMLATCSESKKGITYIAKRDLQAGTIVLSEFPVISGPADRMIEDKVVLMCMVCGKVLLRRRLVNKNKVVYNACSSCSWPVCSSSCEKARIHKWYECKYLKDKKIKFPGLEKLESAYLLYRSIICLRFYRLKETDPHTFASLMKSNANKAPEDAITTSQQDAAIFRLLSRTFQARNLLPDDEEEAENEVSAVLDRIAIYGFNGRASSDDRDKAFEESRINCIYKCATLIRRSCIPNVVWAMSSSPTFSLKLIACKPIQRGEELILPVRSNFHLWGTRERQQHMISYFGSPCQCKRCKDPTEMGSYLSGLKCDVKACGKGYLLAMPSKGGIQNQSLTCSNATCGKRVFIKDLSGDLKMMGKHVSDLLKKRPGVEVLEQQLQQFRSEGFLHKSHYLLVALEWEIVRQQVERLHVLLSHEVVNFVEKCDYLLNIESLVGYGLSYERALLCYYLGRAFYCLYEQTTHWRSSKRESEKVLHKIMDLYFEANSFFKLLNEKDKSNPVWKSIRLDMTAILSKIKSLQF